jgi:hypothetical protein
VLWSDNAIDFVKELPCVSEKSVILTVVDRFSKSAHFIALGHPYTSNSVAWAFFVDNVQLHGIPSSIVSGQDQVFTSTFWHDLFTLAGVHHKMSFVFHPQSNGQLEATNNIIVMYLRCLTGDRPRHWLQRLPLWARPAFTTFYEPGEAHLPAAHGYRYVYQYRTDTDTWIRHFLRKPDTWIRFIIF